MRQSQEQVGSRPICYLPKAAISAFVLFVLVSPTITYAAILGPNLDPNTE